MPLSAAHKAKISEGLKKYHACAREAGCGNPKGAVAVRRKFKRLRRVGSKAAPKQAPVKTPARKTPARKTPARKKTPKRRVALTAAKKPKRRVALTKVGGTRKAKSKPFGGAGMEFTGLKTYRKAVDGLEAKYGGGVDIAPGLGF